MKFPSRWLAATLLVLATTIVAIAYLKECKRPHFAVRFSLEHTQNKLTKKLDLTSEQAKALHAILENHRSQFGQLQTQAKQIEILFASFHEKVATFLEPEQIQSLKEVMRRHRHHKKKESEQKSQDAKNCEEEIIQNGNAISETKSETDIEEKIKRKAEQSMQELREATLLDTGQAKKLTNALYDLHRGFYTIKAQLKPQYRLLRASIYKELEPILNERQRTKLAALKQRNIEQPCQTPKQL